MQVLLQPFNQTLYIRVITGLSSFLGSHIEPLWDWDPFLGF
jgi:hypothetical protein